MTVVVVRGDWCPPHCYPWVQGDRGRNLDFLFLRRGTGNGFLTELRISSQMSVVPVTMGKAATKGLFRHQTPPDGLRPAMLRPHSRRGSIGTSGSFPRETGYCFTMYSTVSQSFQLVDTLCCCLLVFRGARYYGLDVSTVVERSYVRSATV